MLRYVCCTLNEMVGGGGTRYNGFLRSYRRSYHTHWSHLPTIVLKIDRTTWTHESRDSRCGQPLRHTDAKRRVWMESDSSPSHTHITTMDRQSVYTLSLFGEEQSANGDSTNKQTQKELVAFVLEFHLDGNYIYRYGKEARGGGGGGPRQN